MKTALTGALVTALVVTALVAAPAGAEVLPGNVAAESIGTAYPIQPGTTYHGAFQPDTASFHDLDYLAFTVAKAPTTLAFRIQNTTTGVKPNDFEFCPVYASILDQTNNQVGGPNSAAGTIATYGDTESFHWTFNVAGTYYLVMESNGDMPPGDPAYAVSFRSATAAAPLVRSLKVSRQQRGTVVRASLTLGQRATRVRASLLTAAGRTIAGLARAPLGTGPHRLKLPLPAAYRNSPTKNGKLNLILRVSVRGASGKNLTFNRRVTLSS